MSQGGRGVLCVGVGWSSQEIVPHQKSRGHHPALDRSEVVSKTDVAGLLLMLPARESRGGCRGVPLCRRSEGAAHLLQHFHVFCDMICRFIHA